MSLEYNEKNLMKAWCETLKCTMIGQASTEDGCLKLQPENVKKTVPEDMHDSYCALLFDCTVKVCTNMPYQWQVTAAANDCGITNTTTFEELFVDWFTRIVRHP